MKEVAKRFGKSLCVEELGGYTEDEKEEETSPEGPQGNPLCLLGGSIPCIRNNNPILFLVIINYQINQQ